MKITSFTSSFAAIAIMALALPACSDDAPTDKGMTGGDAGAGGAGDENAQVEIFSWWSAPGEKEALQALIDLHADQYPKAPPIYNAAADPKIQSGGVDPKTSSRCV